MTRTPLLGTAACATAAVLWASNATVARTAIDRGVEPLELTEVRALAAFLAFSLVALARHGRFSTLRAGALPHEVSSVPTDLPARRATAWRILAFGTSIAIVNLSYFIAIEHLPVAIAIVIQYTAPALVVAYAAIADRARPPRPLVLILTVVMIGVAFASDLAPAITGTTSLSILGIIAALVSAVGFAAYNILAAAVTATLGPVRAHAAGFGVATLIWIVVQVPRGIPTSVLRLDVAPRVAWVAIVGTVLAFGIYALGIARIGASSATIVSTLEPVATVILGVIVLRQSLTAAQSFGAVLVLGGVVALSLHTARADA